jgi:ribosomal protein S18 acetylase RimI-like enzyme
MTATTLRMRPARSDEKELLLQMLRAFYEEDAIPFDASRVQHGLSLLLESTAHGALLILESDDLSVAGYAALGWCFSMEQGGRFALLDELYLVPAARGRGLGKQALNLVQTFAQSQGMCAVRLEVNHHNARAKTLYQQQGYRDDQRDMLTLPLELRA